MKRGALNKLIVFISIVVVLTAVLTTGYSWLQSYNEVNNTVVISDFEIDSIVYFNDNGPDLQNGAWPANGYHTSGELIEVNVTDPNAANYMGKLAVAVRYLGVSPAYIRIRIFEQWVRSDEFIPVPFTPYIISGKPVEYVKTGDTILTPVIRKNEGGYFNLSEGTWFDNRSRDFGFYFTVPVQAPQIASGAMSGEVILSLFNGIAAEDIERMNNYIGSGDNAAELKIMIEAQGVQPNRFRELFDLEELPWLSAAEVYQ